MEVETLESSQVIGKWNGGPDGMAIEPTTILCVEDEAFVRQVTCEVLRSAGYSVLTAKDAGEAIRIFENAFEGIALLLTDVILPGKNGRWLANNLLERNPALKILLVTGYADQMKFDAGSFEGCLAKPFSSEVLLARIEGILNRQSLNRQSKMGKNSPAVFPARSFESAAMM